MRKNVLSVAAVIVTLGWSMPALPLMGDHMAGFPVGQPPQWPDGMAYVLNSPGRVYGFFFNFGDMFNFVGDAQDFNHFLEGYAKLKEIDPVLTLHSGRGEANQHFGGGKFPFDWVISLSGYLQEGKRVCSASLSAWVGGQIELSELKVPENIKLQGGGNEEIAKFIAAHEARRTAPSEKRIEKPPDAGRRKSSEVRIFASERPLFGKVALTEDGSKVLCLALDESKGTWTGYDLLWADLNLNGRFEATEKFPAAGTKRHGSWLASSSFPAISLEVPFDETAEGVSNPCGVTLGYRQYPRHGVAEEISVRLTIKQRQDSALWEHSLSGSALPSKRLETAPVWKFGERPMLEVSGRPDGYRKGNLGVGLELKCGENTLQCWKGGQPVKAHVKITTPEGEVAHQGEATLDRFTFG